MIALWAEQDAVLADEFRDGNVPAGTGMGSSSSLAVGLLNALYAYKGQVTSPGALAGLRSATPAPAASGGGH